MASLGRLVVTLSANIAEFAGALDKASYIADQRARAIQRSLERGMAMAAKAAAAAAAIIVTAIKKAVDYASDLTDLSESIGMNVESFQALAVAAAQSGVSADDFRNMMVKLQQSIADNNPALAAMGIAVRDANGNLRSTEDVLFDLAKVFPTYRDGVGKTALANDALGKSGFKLVPTLNQGEKALREFIERARESGQVLSKEAVKSIDDFGDKIGLLTTHVRVLAGNFTFGLITALEDVGKAFSFSLGKAESWQKAGEALGAFIKDLIVGFVTIAAWAEYSGKKIGGYAIALTQFFAGNYKEASRIIEQTNANATSVLDKATEKARLILRGSNAAIIKDQQAALAESKRLADEAAKAAKDAGLKDPPSVAAFTKSQKEAADKAKELAGIITQLEDSFRSLAFTEEAIIIQRAQGLGATEEQIALIRSLIGATKDLEAQQKAQLEAEQKSNKAKEDAKQLVASLPDLYFGVASSAERYRIELERVYEVQKKLIEAGAKQEEIDQYVSAAVKDIEDRYNGATEAAKDFSRVIAQGFEDAIVGGKSLSDVLKALADDILRIIIRVNVTKPLEDALTNLMGSGGGSSGSGGFFSTLLKSFLGGWFGGSVRVPASSAPATSAIPWVSPKNITGLATGGEVVKGRTYLVGERGPELFTSLLDGQIVSNAELMKMLAAQPRKEVSELASAIQDAARTTRPERSGTKPSLSAEFMQTVTEARKTAESLARPSAFRLFGELLRSGLIQRGDESDRESTAPMSVVSQAFQALSERLRGVGISKPAVSDFPIAPIVKQAVESAMGRQRVAPSAFGPDTLGQIGEVARAAIAEITNRQQPAMTASSAPARSTRQVFNITTPNADSFRLSQRQIARRARGFVAA